MRDLLPWVNLAGFLAAWVQAYRRVGFAEVKREYGVDWREFLLPNLLWFGLTAVKVLLWWLTFLIWFVQGRPEPTWRAVVEEDGLQVRLIERTER